ncbi:hypothetical protein GO755_35305 [Spirosoma sp. HMF4905]|uniref:Uncharacterized protein n=1 Tax=Spirosoma arboris TaxID=2682092 RepID=A0A7K1SNG2_9BACT|nr:hypothetical protein [Spirosoma arboris]MVM35344.1 hypothetical protein [Spirosoma arboris]
MNELEKKGTSSVRNDSFDQLMINYIRQVGMNYQSDKSVQLAVKRLEKTIKKND